MKEKLIIIGSGPAGLTAAIYAARANLEPFLFEGFQSGGIPGGQLMITTVIENFPGFPEGITGPDLMMNMRDQALRHGARMIVDDVLEADCTARPFSLLSANGENFQADALIIASGAIARRLPLDSEMRLWGRGISACATCDGALPIFRNRELAVIGGGDTAIEEALHLTQFASKVYLIHRRGELRATRIMQKRAKNNQKIEILWNKVVEDFIGDKVLSCLKLRDTLTGSTSSLPVAGAFEAIGHVPNTAFLKGDIKTSSLGYIVTGPGSTKTSIAGIFAAGDVQDHKYRQAVTAAGSGCMAAKEAEMWLRDQGLEG
jgi:thioredoxin reductase (NADPH)